MMRSILLKGATVQFVCCGAVFKRCSEIRQIHTVIDSNGLPVGTIVSYRPVGRPIQFQKIHVRICYNVSQKVDIMVKQTRDLVMIENLGPVVCADPQSLGRFLYAANAEIKGGRRGFDVVRTCLKGTKAFPRCRRLYRRE